MPRGRVRRGLIYLGTQEGARREASGVRRLDGNGAGTGAGVSRPQVSSANTAACTGVGLRERVLPPSPCALTPSTLRARFRVDGWTARQRPDRLLR